MGLELVRDEQAQVGWRGSAGHIPADSVAGLFARQVAMVPTAPAVVFKGSTLDYAELDRRANRLARHLISRGIGSESVVAVAAPRSADVVVSLLAVAKTGAAYLPVDLDYPAERIAFMLADARPACVLTTLAGVDHLPDGDPDGDPGGRVVLDDPSVATDLAGRSGTALTDADVVCPVTPRNAAYVIYTSGSTGRPKGVVIEQGSLTDYLSWSIRTYPSVRGRSLWHSSVSFDMTVTSLWAPLVTGGCVVVAELAEHALPDGPSCTFLKATPSHLPLLAALPEQYSPTGELMFGGEALVGEALQEWRDAHPDVTVLNVYGPTEVTVNAAEFRVEPHDPARAGVLPLGRPMDNTVIYVLDDRLGAVPPGEIGEIYIAGAGLARGYLNRPDLTAERFVADPFGAPGIRMYRTGDLGRWAADGVLEFAGRVDDQVKLRGFRIELGEIESVLAAHPDVVAARVVVREDQPGDRRIVGYAVPAAAGPEPAELRGHLAERLPEHMVPSAVVLLAALPLTTNGKVDRRALPAPDYPAGSAGRAARGQDEEILCGLMADVLDVAAVGIDDDFFELGGHSLLAIRLTTRIRIAFGVEVPLGTVFDRPTVRGLTEVLSSAGAARPQLRVVERPDRVPLSAAQQRLWFLHRLEDAAPLYNVAWLLRLTGSVDHEAVRQGMGDVLARHESLRTVFPDADDPYQHILPPSATPPEVPVVDTDVAALADRIESAARYGFALDREPPVRVTLFRVAEHDHRLLIVQHHIITDGLSAVPMIRDLATAYAARCGGRAPDWTALPVQYADYALWQRELLGSETDPDSVIARQVVFWKEELAGAPELLELPTDRMRPAAASYRGGTVDFRLDSAVHRRAVELAHRTGTTVYMVVQAAVAALLTRLGAGEDIPLGTATAGRDDEALDDLVGFFVNTLVLRTDTSGDPRFVDLLARVRSTDLAAYAHRDVAFERLVEALAPTRSLAHNPLFQVSLTFQDSAEPAAAMPGLDVTLDGAGTSTAKVDLAFSMRESRAADGSAEGVEAQ
ncbi:MAG: amino acid adenylation domain-containing protein, partial [Actinomycetota bacterium]|nr:amino acid adenylation domain-containing protein [Actinomycetota bacterium]